MLKRIATSPGHRLYIPPCPVVATKLGEKRWGLLHVHSSIQGNKVPCPVHMMPKN